MFSGLERGLKNISEGATPSRNEKAPQRSRNNVEGHGRNKNNCSVPWIG